MRHRYLKASIAGTILSLTISLLIINITRTPIEEILAISPTILALSLSLNLVRFTAQGLRLHILLRKYSRTRHNFRTSFILRGASEFFALTTLPFMADEAARTWLLSERGERVGPAFWISFTEMLLDTLVGSLMALAAGLSAALTGIYYVASPILAISLTQLVATVVFIAFVKTTGGGWMRGLTGFVVERLPMPAMVRKGLKDGSADMVRVIGSTISTRHASTLVILLFLTVAVMTTPAAILDLLSDGCVFLGCLYAFHSGNALGVLPISVGGSGLTEAGVYIYQSMVLGANSLKAVLQWRVATYYLALIISGMLLIVATLGKKNTRSSVG